MVKNLGVAVRFAGLFVVLSGCAALRPHYGPVQAMASVGEMLSGHNQEWEAPYDFCVSMNAFSAENPQKCDDLRKQSERWGKVASLLATYSSKLSELAEQKDVSVKEQVSSVLSASSQAGWIDLKDDAQDGVGELAKFVLELSTRTYKSFILQESIGKANPHVYTVVAAMKGYAKLQTANLQAYEKTIDLHIASMATIASSSAAPPSPGPAASSAVVPAGLVPKGKPAPSALAAAPVPSISAFEVDQAAKNRQFARISTASLMAMKNSLKARQDGLDRLSKTAEAFGDAHNKLAYDTSKVDKKEMLIEILNRIKEIQGAVHAVQGNGGLDHGSPATRQRRVD